MKAPVFAYGTMEALERVVESGQIKYPAYVWLKDTLQYAFVNKNSEIEVVGLPKLTGTLNEQIILSDLSGGVYEIKGQYKVSEDAETVYMSSAYIIAIIRQATDSTMIRLITADSILDFVVEEGIVTDTDKNVTEKYLTEHGYVTEDVVDSKIAAMEVTLKQEIKDYVDSIIAEQIAELLPEELDKILQPVVEEEIRKLFGDIQSI